MISKFFITRPIFACVISAFIVIAGLAGMHALPISAYPDIVPPMVTLAARYPGATAETIAETVAAPLEQEINGVENMLYMQSVNSGDGQLMINITFAIGSDPGPGGDQRQQPRSRLRCRACPKKCGARASWSARRPPASCRWSR